MKYCKLIQEEMKIFNYISLFVLFSTAVFGQNTNRWNFSDDTGIHWNVKKGSAHSDHIEMSGLQISTIIQYGVSDKGELLLKKNRTF